MSNQKWHPLHQYLNKSENTPFQIAKDLSHAIYLMHYLKKQEFADFEVTNICARLHELERVMLGCGPSTSPPA